MKMLHFQLDFQHKMQEKKKNTRVNFYLKLEILVFWGSYRKKIPGDFDWKSKAFSLKLILKARDPMISQCLFSHDSNQQMGQEL